MPKPFSKTLQSYVQKSAPAKAGQSEVVEKEFVQDLIRSGRAKRRKAGEELPEYEIVDENTIVHHYVK